MSLSFSLSEAERTYLARLARMSIESKLAGTPPSLPPEPDCRPASTETGAAVCTLRRALGSFVTLTMQGQLRGCIGAVIGREPLYQNVWRMAGAAAFEDPRFPPLTLPEWGKAALHISVLDELTPCPDPEAVEVGRHGLGAAIYGSQRRVSTPGSCGTGLGSKSVPEQSLPQGGFAARKLARAGARLFWYEALVFPG